MLCGDEGASLCGSEQESQTDTPMGFYENTDLKVAPSLHFSFPRC